jgi:MobA/MobL family
MLTMRELVVEDGSARFGNKNRSWNDKNLATEYRKNWEVIANRYLSKAGHQAQIDCRTLEAQGIVRVPQIHLGAKASAMKSKNIKTNRGNIYDEINERNFNIGSKKEELLEMQYEMKLKKAELRLESMLESPNERSIRENSQALALKNISNLDQAIADIDRQIQEIESNLVKELNPEPSEVFIKLDPSEIFIKLDPEPGEIWIELDPEPAEVSRQEQNYNRGFGR